MTPEQLLKQFRSEVVDTAKPYLWSDEEVYRYMNSAYRKFVQETGGVADVNTEEVCEVAYSAGDQFVELHPSILRITRVTLDGEKLAVKNITDMDKAEEDYGRPIPTNLDESGTVSCVVIGEKRNLARLVKVPDTAGTLKLNVYRMPLGTIQGASSTFADVEDDHHEYFSLWMQYRAFSKQDSDGYNEGLSKKRQEEFLRYCRDVTAQWERYKSKVRVVGYTGI